MVTDRDDRPARLAREREGEGRPPRPAARMGRERDRPDRMSGGVGDGAEDAHEAPGGGEAAALHLHDVGARRAHDRVTLLRIVDHATDGRNDDRTGAPLEERLAFPENRCVASDHPRRRHEVPGLQTYGKCPGEPERDDRALRKRPRRSEPDAGRSRSSPPRRPLLRSEGTSEDGRPGIAGATRQFRVQATLRTVSRTLSDVASVAAGSNPEWMAQCSQR